MVAKNATQEVDKHEPVTLEGLIGLTFAYSLALVDEAVTQKFYNEAQELTQYQRDNVARLAYSKGDINGANERQKKLQELYFISEDKAVPYLEGMEDQALRAYTLTSVERKRIEAEISLTKAWLYSQSGASHVTNYGPVK